ncbi:MAG: transketolase [Clostridia bacterium]|nr:transketolase [Clostridia bacterium]
MDKINLELKAKQIRRSIVKLVHDSKSGHPGGSLSATDILTVLYNEVMNLGLDEKSNRIDKFVLSKGHATALYYSILASVGLINEEDLKGYRKYDGFLEGHPSNKIPGVDSSSGSLGQGLSVACGMALAKKIDKDSGYVYCLLGDGELEEGQIWEAFMSINKFKLNNLISIIDYNGLQIDGNITHVKALDSIKEKVQSFGLEVIEIDGHDVEQILNALNNAKKSNIPTCIIAKTVKGKGVSFMENKAEWHGKAINDEEYEIAIKELV